MHIHLKSSSSNLSDATNGICNKRPADGQSSSAAPDVYYSSIPTAKKSRAEISLVSPATVRESFAKVPQAWGMDETNMIKSNNNSKPYNLAATIKHADFFLAKRE